MFMFMFMRCRKIPKVINSAELCKHLSMSTKQLKMSYKQRYQKFGFSRYLWFSCPRSDYLLLKMTSSPWSQLV